MAQKYKLLARSRLTGAGEHSNEENRKTQPGRVTLNKRWPITLLALYAGTWSQALLLFRIVGRRNITVNKRRRLLVNSENGPSLPPSGVRAPDVADARWCTDTTCGTNANSMNTIPLSGRLLRWCEYRALFSRLERAWHVTTFSESDWHRPAAALTLYAVNQGANDMDKVKPLFPVYYSPTWCNV